MNTIRFRSRLFLLLPIIVLVARVHGTNTHHGENTIAEDQQDQQGRFSKSKHVRSIVLTRFPHSSRNIEKPQEQILEEECVICLKPKVQNGGEQLEHGACGDHEFHKKCLEEWKQTPFALMQNFSCPTCRVKVERKREEPARADPQEYIRSTNWASISALPGSLEGRIAEFRRARAAGRH